MGSTAAFYVIIALAVGGYAGWHIRHASGMHADIQTYKTRIPRFRKARMRSGLISAGLVLGVLLMLRALLTH
jgi:hypothetical protein